MRLKASPVLFLPSPAENVVRVLARAGWAGGECYVGDAGWGTSLMIPGAEGKFVMVGWPRSVRGRGFGVVVGGRPAGERDLRPGDRRRRRT